MQAIPELIVGNKINLSVMGKNIPDKNIAETYPQYRLHMGSAKVVQSPFIVSEIKQNHRDSYVGEIEATCDYPYGNTYASCEIKHASEYNYSFAYLSDGLQTKVMARLDAGRGTHRNTAPGIPLALSSVRTPHFHEYRKDGYLIAYPIEGLDYDSEDSATFGLSDGFDYFCNRLNIRAKNTAKPEFEFRPIGRLPFTDKNIDPTQNVNYPEIDGYDADL